MGACVMLLSNLLNEAWNSEMSRKVNGLIVLICMIAGAAIYAGLLFIFKINEAKIFIDYLKKKIVK
jgi:hypothetical protein